MTKIDLFKPALGHEELSAVKEVFESGWIGYGQRSEGVERSWASQVGAKYGIATNSCTSALQIAMRLRNVGPGDEVIVPTITFAATAEAVLAVGAKPVFCDVKPDTLLIDLNFAKGLINQKTKAIVPVLYAGQPLNLGDEYLGIPLIYDCAHAAGSSFDASGKLCCWSFQSVKNLGCGDGGMVTTDVEAFQSRGKRLSWHGIARSTWNRASEQHYTWDYDIAELGYKAQMNDITASILSSQINRMGLLQSIRRGIAYRYAQRLRGIPIVGCNDRMDLNSWHLCVIKTEYRNELSKFLANRGIASGVHYRPLHLHTVFESKCTLPVAEREWKTLLSLPIHTSLTDEDVDRVCDTIREFFSEKSECDGHIVGMELLPLTVDDIEFAREMRNINRDSFIDNRIISREQQAAWYKDLKQKPHIDFRIIWFNGMRVGTMSVTTHRDGSREIGNGTVHQAFRGKGIATAAESKLLDPTAKCWGTYLVENVAAAIVMKRAGWEPIPIRRETTAAPRNDRQPIDCLD